MAAPRLKGAVIRFASVESREMPSSKVRSCDLAAVFDGRKAIIMRNDGDAILPTLAVLEAVGHAQAQNRELIRIVRAGATVSHKFSKLGRANRPT
jgi:hypothetical protein